MKFDQQDIAHKFVEFIPDVIEQGVLYISIDYCTAVHKCICGCGNEVVTPLSPTDWELTFNGKTVSLNPSIGNWNFPCKSHYFITKSKIHHAKPWSEWAIKDGRQKDIENKKRYFKKPKKVVFSQKCQSIITLKVYFRPGLLAKNPIENKSGTKPSDCIFQHDQNN